MKAIWVIIVCLWTLTEFAWGAIPHAAIQPAMPAPTESLPVAASRLHHQLGYKFKDLGELGPIHLNGVDDDATLSFGLRRDELVAKALLRIRFAYSPALIPQLSHIKILLNGEVAATLPLSHEQAGVEQTREVELDPRYLSDFNELRFQLVGHYLSGQSGAECEDAMHSSLWASISNLSQLEFTAQVLELPNDLAILPEPFFDFRDNRRLELPFLFGGKPSRETLQAAGVAASWFGAQAAYRGARFPVLLNGLPGRHAIVFATNQERTDLLPLPQVDAPTLALTSHPQDPNIKLLLILGRDGADLKQAVEALVLGQAVLSGSTATVKNIHPPPRRAAYDAPNWVKTGQAVKLGELVSRPDDLQIRNRRPHPIRVNVRVPPDLLVWQNKGVPLQLKYRYTPPVADDDSTLSIGVNDLFTRSLRLKPERQGATDSLLLPLRNDERPMDKGDIRIPAFQVGADNQLQFQFVFDYHKQGLCRSYQLDNVWAAIDPDSVIDFSYFAHYAEMPDLSFFAQSGFPFTQYADLAETVVVLPDDPVASDIETLLTLLGRMGKSTGLPALRFRLLDQASLAANEDADLLLIDTSPKHELLNRWREHLPARIDNKQRSFFTAFRRWANYKLFDFDSGDHQVAADQTLLEAEGPLSAFIGFESPLHDGRSVVVVMASAPEVAETAVEALENTGLVSYIRGDVAFVRGGKVESFRLGKNTYFLGELPVWMWIWFHLSRHPWVLACFGILAGALVAFLSYWALRRVARKRLKT
ncbi:MAG: cellulose biosynthesis cyclic di-GMP-binding regulatory protein BcsB [Methylococcaceae bacterium]|nr:cellulose biosynthesis cyclic di-GMP-binding regulatory protein BcsB [Methylococcaceae bacterium]